MKGCHEPNRFCIQLFSFIESCVDLVFTAARSFLKSRPVFVCVCFKKATDTDTDTDTNIDIDIDIDIDLNTETDTDLFL